MGEPAPIPTMPSVQTVLFSGDTHSPALEPPCRYPPLLLCHFVTQTVMFIITM